MPVVELIEESGQSGEGDFVRRQYFARGYASSVLAMAAVASTAPATIGSLELSRIGAAEQVEDGYLCDAEWLEPGEKEQRSKVPLETDETQINFEIGTQPVKVFVPISPHDVYTHASATAPADSDRWLIGDQGDGERPEGAEVFEPTASFSITKAVPDSEVNQTFRNALLELVGTTNNATFYGWAAGSLLFMGATGSKRGANDWEITFRFSARKNQTGLTISEITGIDKEGWQYLWPRYRLKDDGTAKIVSNVVEHIVVSTVFRSGDFAALDL